MNEIEQLQVEVSELKSDVKILQNYVKAATEANVELAQQVQKYKEQLRNVPEQTQTNDESYEVSR